MWAFIHGAQNSSAQEPGFFPFLSPPFFASTFLHLNVQHKRPECICSSTSDRSLNVGGKALLASTRRSAITWITALLPANKPGIRQEACCKSTLITLVDGKDWSALDVLLLMGKMPEDAVRPWICFEGGDPEILTDDFKFWTHSVPLFIGRGQGAGAACRDLELHSSPGRIASIRKKDKARSTTL